MMPLNRLHRSSISSAETRAPQAEQGAFVAAARAAWPILEFDTAEFLRYAAERAAPRPCPPLANAGDLLLAFACVTRAPGAVAAFQKKFEGVLARVLSRRKASVPDAADVAQIVYERLLVAAPGSKAGSSPKLADYRGDGPLKSWVSTSVATTLLMMRRTAGRRRERASNSPELEAVAGGDPELLHLKRRYGSKIEAAVVRALKRIGERERTLLKLHLGERMSIDHLGALYGVNRATAARWLSGARAALVDYTREEVRANLRVSESECDSLMALVRSDLDVSIVRHLAGATR
jgi:RNA polymerase sigma-70 factor (ECF subfamily)